MEDRNKEKLEKVKGIKEVTQKIKARKYKQ
jgi:hypothetical protein